MTERGKGLTVTICAASTRITHSATIIGITAGNQLDNKLLRSIYEMTIRHGSILQLTHLRQGVTSIP